MSGIIDKLTSIVEGVVSLPITIAEYLLQILHEIFVPDTDVINQQFNTTMENLKEKIGVTIFDLDNLFSSSGSPADINSNYNIAGVGTMNLKFVNYKYLVDGVNFFRPFIRGFIVLLLFFFNIRQLLSMFGLSSGEIESAAKGGNGK